MPTARARPDPKRNPHGYANWYETICPDRDVLGKTETYQIDWGTWGTRVGCDIHMVLETMNNDGKWVGFETFQGRSAACTDTQGGTYISCMVRSRNYNLFARLAGVRGEGPEPRGVPADASDLAKMEIDTWGIDGHSHSWGLLSEIGGYFLAAYVPVEILQKDRHNRVLDLFGVWRDDKPLEAYRLVYWFDN